MTAVRSEATAPGREAGGRRDDLRALLRGSPAAALAKLVPGDPLDVRLAVRKRLEQRALLMDAERVTLRGLARCARYGSTLGERAALRRWVSEQVDASIDELLRVEHGSGDGGAFVELGRPLGIGAAALRAACLAVNRFPVSERRLFFAVCIEGVPIDRVARGGGSSASSVARRARRVLDAALAAASEGRGVRGRSLRRARVNGR